MTIGGAWLDMPAGVDDNKIGENNPKYRSPTKRERDGKVFDFRKTRFVYNGFRIPGPSLSKVLPRFGGFTKMGSHTLSQPWEPIVRKGRPNWRWDAAMNLKPTFVKRIGPDPHTNGTQTTALSNCPDIWELDSGDFAVIRIDITTTAVPKLHASASCGPDECIVLIPRNLLVNAKPEIPNHI